MGDNSLIRGRRTSWVLSLLAFLPMVVLALLLVLTERENASFLPLLDAFKTVSAIILSFLGGIRWGMSLRGPALSPLALAATLLPGLIGWVCMFTPDILAVSLLLLSVCAMGAWDSFSLHGGSGPHWFAKIRTIMTLLAALVHGAVLLVIL